MNELLLERRQLTKTTDSQWTSVKTWYKVLASGLEIADIKQADRLAW